MTDTKAALLVASSVYDDPQFRRLRAPAHDVEALSRVLGDPDIGGFEVRSLLNERSWVIAEEIEGFFSERGVEDLLVLFLSCHGVKDPAGRLHFAAANTRFERLGSTGISAAWVNEQMDRSRSRRIVLLLDCCYSGAFARGLAPRSSDGVHVMEQLSGRGRAVITASDAMEYAYEGDDLALEAGQPSVFTRALVRGLATGDADRDRDGRVTIDELYGYLYDKVRETTPVQTPTISTIGLRGELYFARNPHPPLPRVEPAPLPVELRQAVDSEMTWRRSGAVAGLRRLVIGASPELALAAKNALRKLAADDDQEVSAAASAALVAFDTGEGVTAAAAEGEQTPAPPREEAAHAQTRWNVPHEQSPATARKDRRWWTVQQQARRAAEEVRTRLPALLVPVGRRARQEQPPTEARNGHDDMEQRSAGGPRTGRTPWRKGGMVAALLGLACVAAVASFAALRPRATFYVDGSDDSVITSPGDCVTLEWNIENVVQPLLESQPYQDYKDGVDSSRVMQYIPPTGIERVCPDEDFIYSLGAEGGRTLRQVIVHTWE